MDLNLSTMGTPTKSRTESKVAFRNPNEIKTERVFYHVWWDLQKDRVYVPITGTIPPLERRWIQDAYGRIVHLPDSGELLIVDGECGYLQVRLKCQICGKEFCADC
jgi:hypothetical protein